MPPERDRTRLIAELANLLRDCHLPDDARTAGLTLIGWLARRMPGEPSSTDGVKEARAQMASISGCSLEMRVSGESVHIQKVCVERVQIDRAPVPGGLPGSPHLPQQRATSTSFKVQRTKKLPAA